MAQIQEDSEMPNCPVCYEVYDEVDYIPILLSHKRCGHSLCSSCLPMLLKSNSGNPVCMACRGKLYPVIGLYPENKPLQKVLKKFKHNKIIIEKRIKEVEMMKRKYMKLVDACGYLVGHSVVETCRGISRKWINDSQSNDSGTSAELEVRESPSIPKARYMPNWQLREAEEVLEEQTKIKKAVTEELQKMHRLMAQLSDDFWDRIFREFHRLIFMAISVLILLIGVLIAKSIECPNTQYNAIKCEAMIDISKFLDRLFFIWCCLYSSQVFYPIFFFTYYFLHADVIIRDFFDESTQIFSFMRRKECI